MKIILSSRMFIHSLCMLSAIAEPSSSLIFNSFCGFNSYCLGMGNKDVYKCYLGFHFSNASNKFLGCYKNLSDDGCRRSKHPSILFSIVSLENMWWNDYPYSVVQME